MQENEPSPLETALSIIRQDSYPTDSKINALLYMVEKYEPGLCLPAFIDILNDDSHSPDLRNAAALALGRVGGKTGLDELLSLLEGEDKALRLFAIQGLGFTQDAKSIPVLIAALNDEDNTIFQAAAESLGKLGQLAITPLISLLSSAHSEDIRCIAAWQLGVLKAKEALPPLLTIIQTADNEDLIALAIWASGEIGVSESGINQALREAKQSESPAISERAALAIKKIARHNN